MPTTPADDPAETPGTGLRERKKASRRRALVDASHRLVAEHGLDAVTVEMICAEVGVSVRTFFNYFPAKDDAVLGHVPWSLDEDEVRAFVAGGPTGDLLEDVVELVAALAATHPLGHERTHRALELVTAHPRLMAHHVAWMEQQRSQLEGLVRDRLGTGAPYGADVVASLVILCAHTALMRWEAAGAGGDVRPYVTAVAAELRHVVTA